jgi:hypothetical protein
MVFEDHTHVITLVDLNRRPGSAAAEAPDIDRLHWADPMFDNFGDQPKHFGVAIHCERMIADVRCDNGHVES